MVLCGQCDEAMSATITNKWNKAKTKETRYFYYRCETQGCAFCNKSVRANIIMEFVIEFFESRKFATKEAYGHYLQDLTQKVQRVTKELDGDRRSLVLALSRIAGRAEKTKEYLLDAADPVIKKIYEEDLKKMREDEKSSKKKLGAVLEKLAKVKDVPLSYEEFLELFGSLPVVLRKATTLNAMDRIVREIFLNFTVTGNKVAAFRLLSPFDALAENGLVFDGGQ